LTILRPREGVCGKAKIFGSALLQPASSACVSLSAFPFDIFLLPTAVAAIVQWLRHQTCTLQTSVQLTVSHWWQQERHRAKIAPMPLNKIVNDVKFGVLLPTIFASNK